MNIKLKIVQLGLIFFVAVVHAQDYCEPPVRGVYESGPDLKDIFSFQASEVPVFVEDDFLLEPGKQAGQFFLKTSVEDIKAKLPLGEGKNKANPINQQNNVYYESYAEGLGFYFKQDNLVLIEVNNVDYKTRDSLAIGASEKKLQDIKDCQVSKNQYQCDGINFILLDEVIKTIHIFVKND
ncbi:MAG TPA: hypothetical protein PKC21_07735 [Oligoflexia bacterium]|nr:hypothetical protein [Oligoflexia bacterium]HMR25228.1 hypothetical protein [Oligoflexia bacterium]